MLGAALDHAFAPLHLFVIERGPGHVVHGSGSGNAAAFGGRGVEDGATAPLVAANLPRRGALGRKAERVLQEVAASLRGWRGGAPLFQPLDGGFSPNLR